MSTTYFRGVADAGPEFGGNFPGTYGVDYHYDGLGTLQYLALRGHKLVRLPFSWERIQPTRGQALDATELGRITTYLSNAASVGVKVILDMHNYARRIEGGVTKLLYDDFPESDLIDVWTRLSTALKGNPAVYAYEVMNEPHDLSTLSFPFTPSATVADFDSTGLTLTGWGTNGGEPVTYALSTAQAHDGTHSLGATATTWAASGFDDVRLFDRQNTYTYDPNNPTISAWVYIPSTAGTSFQGFMALVASNGHNDAAPAISIPTNTWTELTWTPAASTWPSNQGLIIQLGGSAAGGTPTFFVDGIQLGNKPADILPYQRWHTTTQNLVNAIRANNNDTTQVYVDGYQWASASFWTTNNPGAPWITDPANNTRYIAHHYCGVNLSGNFLTFAQETTDAITAGYASLQDQAVQRLQVFTNWVRQYGVKAGVTEIAWRQDESQSSWNAVGEAMYEELDSVGADVTYWAGGEWWNYPTTSYIAYTASADPGSVDTAQAGAAVIEAHPSILAPNSIPLAPLRVQLITDSLAKHIIDAQAAIAGTSTLQANQPTTLAQIGTLGDPGLVYTLLDGAEKAMAAESVWIAQAGYNAILDNHYTACAGLDIATSGLAAYLAAHLLQVDPHFLDAFNRAVTKGQAYPRAPLAAWLAFGSAVANMGQANVTGSGTRTYVPGSTVPATYGNAPLQIFNAGAGSTGAASGVYTVTYNAYTSAGVLQTGLTAAATMPATSSPGASVSLGVSGVAVTNITLTGGTNGDQVAVRSTLLRTAGY